MTVNNKIVSSIQNQYLFETISWIRLIEYLKQENTIMKNRLSEVIEEINDKHTLALAEHFQNLFIIKDDFFDHVLHDLHKESEKWKINSIEDSFTNDLIKTYLYLKDQIDFIEKDYITIKKDYFTYLSSLSSESEPIN
jgi:hypothetical protein